MRRRGTHCGRLARKNQISRAQYRVNSGTLNVVSEREFGEATRRLVDSDRVQQGAGTGRSQSGEEFPAGAGMAGSGGDSGAEGETQQPEPPQSQQRQAARSALSGIVPNVSPAGVHTRTTLIKQASNVFTAAS